MTSHLQTVRSAALMLVAAGFLWSAGAGFLGLQKAHAQAQAPGPEVCAGCHEEKVKAFLSTKHGNKVDARTPVSNGGCSVCHKGDLAKHVNDGGGKGVGGMVSLSSKTISQTDKNQICLGCHQKDARRMNWLSSTHANRDTGCTSCHQIHTSHDNVRDKLTQPQVCFACHKEQRVQINKPSRHPILEGKVSCSDCHNVHGNNPKQMEKSQRERSLLPVPHGEARALRAQPPAGDGRLHHLPPAARHDDRQPAQVAPAVPVPGLPRLERPPVAERRACRQAGRPARRSWAPWREAASTATPTSTAATVRRIQRPRVGSVVNRKWGRSSCATGRRTRSG